MVRPKPGAAYRHRKGGRYIVLHLAQHTETLEELVVYKKEPLPDEVEQIWVRPLADFCDGRFDEELKPSFVLGVKYAIGVVADQTYVWWTGDGWTTKYAEVALLNSAQVSVVLDELGDEREFLLERVENEAEFRGRADTW